MFPFATDYKKRVYFIDVCKIEDNEYVCVVKFYEKSSGMSLDEMAYDFNCTNEHDYISGIASEEETLKKANEILHTLLEAGDIEACLQ